MPALDKKSRCWSAPESWCPAASMSRRDFMARRCRCGPDRPRKRGAFSPSDALLLAPDRGRRPRSSFSSQGVPLPALDTKKPAPGLIWSLAAPAARSTIFPRGTIPLCILERPVNVVCLSSSACTLLIVALFLC